MGCFNKRREILKDDNSSKLPAEVLLQEEESYRKKETPKSEVTKFQASEILRTAPRPRFPVKNAMLISIK